LTQETDPAPPAAPAVPERTDTGRRDLRCLFEPTSVAVVGASEDPRKWGNWLARNALLGAHRREVMLVNRRGGHLLEHRAYRSLAELPTPPELVVLAVPAAAFDQAVDQALAAGARAILAVTAGLGETGPGGARVEEAVVERVRRAGAVLLGPNCLGVMDSSAELHLVSNPMPSGSIGLISQSGNLALEVAAKAAAAGLGFNRFASIGNQADLDVADLVEDFARAPGVEAIALYCEDFRRGRRFLEAALFAAETGTPVAMIALAGGGAAARAARSHTGAIVSGSVSVTAACRAAGIEQVSTPRELVDLLQGLLAGHPPAGGRLAVLADGGGHGALAGGLAEERALVLPSFASDLAGRLAAATGTSGGTTNPVDLAGAGENDLWSFARVLETVLASEEVDAVLMTGYFGGYGAYGDDLAATETEVAANLGELVTRYDTALLVHSMVAGTPGATPAIDRLRSSRVPVYSDVESAVAVVARLCERSNRPPRGLPTVPAPLPGPPNGGYFAARALLSAAGFRLQAARLVRDPLSALAAATELGWPVALKAVSVEHKSDAGGVVLGIEDAAALAAVSADLWARLGPGPLSVEAMADTSDGVELLVGCVRDPRFGPVATVGIGGVHAEVLRDVAAALAPLDPGQAEDLIGSLRGASLLTGTRGRQRLDVTAAARSVAILSQVAASHPSVTELEVNPLLVTPSGACGLDARMVVEAPASPHPTEGPPSGSQGGGATP